MATFGNLHVRRVFSVIHFNGANVSDRIDDYKKSLTYTDPVSSDSDSLELTLHDIGLEWLGPMYPQKGDEIQGALLFMHWDKYGDNQMLELGKFTLDNAKFSGGPAELSITAISQPADTSFTTRERTKTWEQVTIAAIGGEIAGKYGMSLDYQGPEIFLELIEQSQQTDAAFCQETVEKYGLSMKVYKDKLCIFDLGQLEAQGPVVTLSRKDFEDDSWEYEDSLDGVYTGARISYKDTNTEEEVSLYVGLKPEEGEGSRTLMITETADNAADADRKARAAVNNSNMKAVTMSGQIWPNAAVVAGATVQIEGMENADGKYLVDKSTITVSANAGTTHDIEMHRCQERL